MDPRPDIYESDPRMRPDSDFQPGSLSLLAPGNRGRLLDPRRTPVTVVGTAPERGSFTVRVDAFEDAGAHWDLFLAEVERFQFDREAERLTDREVEELSSALSRFDRPLRIEVDPQRRMESRREIAVRRRRIAERVADLALTPERVDQAVESRTGIGEAFALVAEIAEAAGVGRLERELAERLVSNPRSGEMVKGHAIVVAELGLCRFAGRIVRDPRVLEGPWSAEARTEHILWRMALAQEMWAGNERVVHRVVSSDDAIGPSTASFTSATFSGAVAESHRVAGEQARREVRSTAQRLPLERVFMTFLETEAMNARFREAEALLLASS